MTDDGQKVYPSRPSRKELRYYLDVSSPNSTLLRGLYIIKAEVLLPEKGHNSWASPDLWSREFRDLYQTQYKREKEQGK